MTCAIWPAKGELPPVVLGNANAVVTPRSVAVVVGFCATWTPLMYSVSAVVTLSQVPQMSIHWPPAGGTAGLIWYWVVVELTETEARNPSTRSQEIPKASSAEFPATYPELSGLVN